MSNRQNYIPLKIPHVHKYSQAGLCLQVASKTRGCIPAPMHLIPIAIYT